MNDYHKTNKTKLIVNDFKNKSSFFQKLIQLINIFQFRMSEPAQAPQADSKHKKLDKIAFQNSLEQNLTWLWKLLTGVIVLVFLAITYFLYYVRNNQSIRDYVNFTGSIPQFLIKSAIGTIIYMAFDLTMHKILDDKVEKYYLTQKHKGLQVRKKRSVSVVKYLIGTIYYVISSLLSYYVLYHSTALPVWMGGNGQCKNLYINYPNQSDLITSMAEFIYIFSMSKHTGRLLLHAFVTSQGNYYSFLLHHFMSMFLILISYSLNFWTAGIFVLFVHDVSDLFNSFVRFYNEKKNKSTLIFMASVATFPLVWIGCRNFIFPCCVIYPIYDAFKQLYPKAEIQFKVYFLPGLFLAIFMLVCLQILHIVWSLALIQYLKTKFEGQLKSMRQKKEQKKQ